MVPTGRSLQRLQPPAGPLQNKGAKQRQGRAPLPSRDRGSALWGVVVVWGGGVLHNDNDNTYMTPQGKGESTSRLMSSPEGRWGGGKSQPRGDWVWPKGRSRGSPGSDGACPTRRGRGLNTTTRIRLPQAVLARSRARPNNMAPEIPFPLACLPLATLPILSL